MTWSFLALLGVGLAWLAGRGLFRRNRQQTIASASGLIPVRDLTHIPGALQRSALWRLSDGGFERQVVHGVVPCGTEDVDVTAFDLETLRERRGEWAYLPVDPPFRIAGVVSVVVCEIDRVFPHYVFKRVGLGDALIDDDWADRAGHVAKAARDGLQMPRSYPAELPAGVAARPLDVSLPEHWRAYGTTAGPLEQLLAAGLAASLERAGRRDLVVEVLDGIVIVYPAAHHAGGADAVADLTVTALLVIEGLLVSSPRLSPRGIEPMTAP